MYLLLTDSNKFAVYVSGFMFQSYSKVCTLIPNLFIMSNCILRKINNHFCTIIQCITTMYIIQNITVDRGSIHDLHMVNYLCIICSVQNYIDYKIKYCSD